MELIPFIYLFIAYIAAYSIGATKRIGVWWSFVICLFITPLLGSLIIAWLPSRDIAYCMVPINGFEVGLSYHYKRTLTSKNNVIYTLYSGRNIKLGKIIFDQHFSLTTNNTKKLTLNY
tara:strand:- start:69 stop:422 length:354 start_codon:yes stop_codon:yes gene_type:complete